MAGTIANLKLLCAEHEEAKAKEIAFLYTSWDNQRQKKKADWKELSEYIFATDTSTTSNSSLPWKNSTTLPKLCQIRDNLNANYVSSIFPNDRWVRWEGKDFEDNLKKKRMAIEAYIGNKCKDKRFKEAAEQLILDFIDYGNAFGFVDYVNEGFLHSETKEWVSTYVGPALKRISPYDIVFNPVADHFDSSPIITREIISVGELYALAEQDSKLMAKLQKRNAFSKSLGKYRGSQMEKAGMMQVDGFGSIDEYYQSGYVEVLKFVGDWFDPVEQVLKRNQEVKIIDRCLVISEKTNDSWLGRKNYFHVAWRNRPDNLYGMGPLENLVGIQYRIDHLENLKADAQDLIVHPPLKIQGEVDPFTWGPGAHITMLDGADVQELTKNLQGILNASNEIDRLEARMEEFAGAPKQAMGVRTPGEKTAFEVQQLENAAGRIFQEKIVRWEVHLLEPALNAMLEIARRKADATDVVKIVDPDSGLEDFLSVTKDDITALGTVRPVGARHFAQQAQLLQNLNQTIGGPLGQMLNPHISRKELSKIVSSGLQLEHTGLFSPNVGVTEDAETQSIVQEAEQVLGEQRVAPTAGGDPSAPPM